MKQFKHLIKPYIIWASILIVVPLILIVLYAFTSDGNEVLTLHFTWANFAKFLEATYLSVILKSFRLGILTTLICLVCGYPLAYIISKYSEKVQSFLILMVTIPMWINMLLRTYAWMNILSDNGLVNNLLKMLGISPITMMYTDFSVIVGLVCNFMPFMIIPIHTSLSKMDKSLIEAANDLGANPFQTFWRITWKLSMPGVVNGIMMVFLLSISTFVIPSEENSSIRPIAVTISGFRIGKLLMVRTISFSTFLDFESPMAVMVPSTVEITVARIATVTET